MSEHPRVTFTMANGGQFVAELYPKQAPNTVANFITLAQKKYYDGLIFHRVIPGFMIQGGCPDGSGMGGPGYGIKGEFTSPSGETMVHERGVLSMARSADPDSAGSQFFVMVAHSAHLDGQYASFGKVLEGLDVVDAIVAQPKNHMDRPEEDQVIESVTVDTFDATFSEPEKA